MRSHKGKWKQRHARRRRYLRLSKDPWHWPLALFTGVKQVVGFVVDGVNTEDVL